jgi:hypothetical protein
MQEDHLCLFQFTFQPSGAIAIPTLVNSKCLPGTDCVFKDAELFGRVQLCITFVRSLRVHY